MGWPFAVPEPSLKSAKSIRTMPGNVAPNRERWGTDKEQIRWPSTASVDFSTGLLARCGELCSGRLERSIVTRIDGGRRTLRGSIDQAAYLTNEPLGIGFVVLSDTVVGKVLGDGIGQCRGIDNILVR